MSCRSNCGGAAQRGAGAGAGADRVPADACGALAARDRQILWRQTCCGLSPCRARRRRGSPMELDASCRNTSPAVPEVATSSVTRCAGQVARHYCIACCLFLLAKCRRFSETAAYMVTLLFAAGAACRCFNSGSGSVSCMPLRADQYGKLPDPEGNCLAGPRTAAPTGRPAQRCHHVVRRDAGGRRLGGGAANGATQCWTKATSSGTPNPKFHRPATWSPV